ncbi:hypothetical protein H5410_056540, partial [Solanum commersonii]
LSNGAGWSRQANRPIVKVKGASEWKFFKDVRQDISYGVVHESLGDPDFRRHLCQKNLCTSIKTLFMDPVGPDRHTGPFLWSNDPRSGNISWTSIKTLAMEMVGPMGKSTHFQNQKNSAADLRYRASCFRWSSQHVFSRSNVPEAGKPPVLLIFRQLLPLGKPTHFQGQTSPEADICQDLNYGAVWSRWETRPIFKVKRFSERTLAMEQVNPDGQIGLFSRSNEPRSGQNEGLPAQRIV